MSFDIFVQGFDRVPVDRSSAVRPVIAPLLSADGSSIRTTDGGADVYGALDQPLQGLMFNHVAGKEAWGVIFSIAKAADWVVMPIGGPVCLVGEHQRGVVPEDMRESGIVCVSSGAELRACATTWA